MQNNFSREIGEQQKNFILHFLFILYRYYLSSTLYTQFWLSPY